MSRVHSVDYGVTKITRLTLKALKLLKLGTNPEEAEENKFT